MSPGLGPVLSAFLLRRGLTQAAPVTALGGAGSTPPGRGQSPCLPVRITAPGHGSCRRPHAHDRAMAFAAPLPNRSSRAEPPVQQDCPATVACRRVCHWRRICPTTAVAMRRAWRWLGHPGSEQILSNDSPPPGHAADELMDALCALVAGPAVSLSQCSARLAPTVSTASAPCGDGCGQGPGDPRWSPRHRRSWPEAPRAKPPTNQRIAQVPAAEITSPAPPALRGAPPCPAPRERRARSGSGTDSPTAIFGRVVKARQCSALPVWSARASALGQRGQSRDLPQPSEPVVVQPAHRPRRLVNRDGPRRGTSGAVDAPDSGGRSWCAGTLNP